MVTKKRLPTQLFCGQKPVREKFNPAKNYGDGAGAGFMKPSGGLWTSTWETAFDVGWPSWCIGEDWRTDSLEPAWLLEPRECRVIELAGFDMCHEFMLRYGQELYSRPTHKVQARGAFVWKEPLPMPEYTLRDGRKIRSGHSLCPVWERVAEDADAVRLLTPYDFDVRLGPYIAFYGWDCESTVWLDWQFEDGVEPVVLTELVAGKGSDRGGW